MSFPASEIASLFCETLSGTPTRARFLLELPYAHLLDRALIFAVVQDGTPAERNFLDVSVAWLHATPDRRASLEATFAAVQMRLQAIAEAA